MFSTSSKKIAEQFWLTELGAKEFTPGIHIQKYDKEVVSRLTNRAVYFATEDKVFVTAPQEFIAELKTAFENSNLTPVNTFIEAMKTKGSIVGGGPAYIGYRDSIDKAEVEIYEISINDERVKLIAKEYPEDWKVFGFDDQSFGPFAVIKDNQILGLSCYKIWGNLIAHIGVLTIPQSRRQGIGENVVRQAIQKALGKNLLPQYRTLWSNKASIRVAEKLGFVHYADTVYVRFSE